MATAGATIAVAASPIPPGASLLFTLVPMVASGYLIQTTVDSEWRRIWVIVHLAASGLWLLGYLAHHVSTLRRPYRRLTSDQR